MMLKIKELEREIEKSVFITGDFNSPDSVVDKTRKQKSIRNQKT